MSIGDVRNTPKVARLTQAQPDAVTPGDKPEGGPTPDQDTSRATVPAAIQRAARGVMRALEQGVERGIEDDARREAGIKKLCPRGGRCRADAPVRGLGPPTDVA